LHCCLNVNYCARECQIDHWQKSHKEICKNGYVQSQLVNNDQDVAVLQRTIFSKNKKIAVQEAQIKSMQQQIESQQQEILTFRESHSVSNVQSLIAEHKEQIAKIKTTVWV